MQTVSDFMSIGLVSMSPEANLVDCIGIMKKKQIGAVMIKENSKTVGIFTERDLLNKVDFTDPAALASLKVKEVMTKNLIVVDHQEPYTNVIELMRTHRIRHTPVTKGGNVIGMISLRDLLLHYEDYLKQLLKENNEQLLKTLDLIRESEQRFRTIFDNSAVGITLTDKDEKIIACNPFVTKLLECDAKDLLSMPVKDLYLPEEWKRIRSLNIRQLGMKHHLETRIFNKRKELIDVDISISVLKDAQQSITGSIGIIRDIRERRKSEAELQKYQEQLEELVKERTLELKKAQNQLIQVEKMQVVGDLATGVAHEVKNPLMIIQQGTDFLSKKIKKKDKEVQLAIKHMDSAVRRADHIIRELLDFASISDLKFKKTNINVTINEALRFVHHQLLKHHIAVKKNLGTRLPKLDLDINKMEQVFIDLFLNAINAMPEKGTLALRSYMRKFDEKTDGLNLVKDGNFKHNDKVLVVEIEDSGIGIPEEIINKIFDPFFTTRRTTGGTGMGLPVVQSIVLMHKGKIKIENRKNSSGAKVTLYWKI